MKGIMMSPINVYALAENRKRQTRRTKRLNEINVNPDGWEHILCTQNPHDRKPGTYASFYNKETEKFRKICAPWMVDEKLWVQEVWVLLDDYSTEINNSRVVRVKYCTQEIKKIPFTTDRYYELAILRSEGQKPSIFMPLEVVRTWLQVINISIQRLNDITIEEISKEGIKIGKNMISYIIEPQFDKFYTRKYTTPRFAWHSLWEGINGKGSLAKNPWVWCLDFKKVDKP